jgi:hypothetical protein
MKWEKFVFMLLVLVMLSSAAMPVMAAENITKLVIKLTSEGYKPKISEITVSKIHVAEGLMSYVYIPFESEKGLRAGIGHLEGIHETRTIAVKFDENSFEINYVSPTGEIKSKSIVIQSSPWNCAECDTSITLAILCCAGTSGAACYACVVAGSVLAVCPCLKCCCWIGYSPCCNAAGANCG